MSFYFLMPVWLTLAKDAACPSFHSPKTQTFSIWAFMSLCDTGAQEVKKEWSQEEHVNNLIKKRSTTDTFISRAYLWGGSVFARHVSAFREKKSCFRVTVLCPLGGLVSKKDLSNITHMFPSHGEMGLIMTRSTFMLFLKKKKSY